MYNHIMVGVFLLYKDEVLLMHRNLNRKIAPDMWSCIGGHMEVEDENDLVKTCLRELREETKIEPGDITDLKLKYITTRLLNDEVRTMYLFWGNLAQKYEVKECEEGSFHWVKLDEINNKKMTFSINAVTNHWLNNCKDEKIYLCSINRNNDNCIFTGV